MKSTKKKTSIWCLKRCFTVTWKLLFQSLDFQLFPDFSSLGWHRKNPWKKIPTPNPPKQGIFQSKQGHLGSRKISYQGQFQFPTQFFGNKRVLIIDSIEPLIRFRLYLQIDGLLLHESSSLYKKLNQKCGNLQVYPWKPIRLLNLALKSPQAEANPKILWCIFPGKNSAFRLNKPASKHTLQDPWDWYIYLHLV